jgi:hypothetical protein
MSDSEEQSLLETLLLTPCLLTGETRLDESQASVWVTPQKGETILFFSVDDQSNSDCRLRQKLWGNQVGEQLCDLIVLYAKGEKRVFCFVELKDNIKDFGKATKQVTNTYEYFKRHLKLKYIPKACIVAASGSPLQEHEKYHSQLLKIFKQANNISILQGKNPKNKDEFGDFLRDVQKKPKGKRKNKR